MTKSTQSQHKTNNYHMHPQTEAWKQKQKINPAGGYTELLMEIQNESAIDLCLLHSFKEGGGHVCEMG